MRKISNIGIIGIAGLLLMMAVAIPASAMPDGGGAIYKINPDGTQTLAESYNGSAVTVTATLDADGKLKIVREDGKPKLLGERSIHSITPDTPLPAAVDTGNSGGGASKVAAQEIDALAAVTYYYSSATNNVIGVTCYAYSGNLNGYAGTEAGDSYCMWWAN
ncbi:MAG: hypothetical protein IBX40_10880 [Methanosarcinales archaeon]|nr:hypothetical protein [Methanosarcinales archaeon]